MSEIQVATPKTRMDDLSFQNATTDLPVETLLMIFKQLFWASCVETTCPCVDPEECFCRKDISPIAWDQGEDLLASSVFPYAITLVCKRWNILIRSDPTFWTRIVIILDEDPTPLLKIQSQIGLSGELPLDFHVLRRQKERDSREYAQSRLIIDFLHSYLYRCRVVVFDLTHNSSLPSITRDLRREAPHLVKLQLRCQIDDGQDYVARPPFQGGSDEDFSSFSLLEILDIDGKNFADCCMDDSYWEDNLSRSIKHSVTISNYTPVSNEVDEQCTMWDFVTGLASIPQISELHLVNLQFDRDLSHWDDVFMPELPYIELKDLDLEFVNRFLGTVVLEDLDHLHITRCSVRVPFLTLHSAHLTLEQVMHDRYFFGRILEEWNGTTLEVINLMAFNDDAIRTLLKNTTPEGPHTRQCRNFIIKDCPNFTVATLKRLITSRNAAFLQSTPSSGVAPRCTLHVSGHGPTLSTEDGDWFFKNLDSFQWDTNQLDS
ncbi:hypothetical protein BDZ94DRAFT_436756 [Collybia nuda]|uniref:F-box domain-containing protein n=1 Tax=Collybia nuda TaxID=64659 RepID=A0A9P5XR76_9AGAR|nr:hypothetical protein BDZ94DRAFT_436756 [Collybia nuda]